MDRTLATPDSQITMRIGFIGAGKVGFSMGKFFALNGLPVSGYYSRSISSAQEAATFTKSSYFASIEDLIAASDAIFVTVPDNVIADVYGRMRRFDLAGKQICHCSGSLSAAEVFTDLEVDGATGYSLHPLFPVSNKYESYKELPNAVFCIEGSAEHLDDWRSLLEKLGARVQVISGSDKKRYHAACVVASNLVCGLAQQGIDMLVSCGFSNDGALEALTPLMRANMDHIIECGPTDALTGPVERNDTMTVAAHVKCLEDPVDRSVYKNVSLKLLDMAAKRHPHNDYAPLREVLKD